MGIHQPQKELFSYHIDLDRRVRADHPLRVIAREIDFTFIREVVAKHYGRNGNESVDPAILLKMMFLLFYDNVASERELMAIIAERMDYLWFLGYGLEEEIPNHSVLSKARRRWGREVFEGVFVRTVEQCVAAGLVEGSKLHVDSSLIDAHASKDSVVKGGPELIAALKAAYQAQESKLEESTTSATYEAVNDRLMSTTDPDAPAVRRGRDSARPRYHHHRAVDDRCGVITAVETTPGSIAENRKLLDLVAQHEQNTEQKVQTVVADSKYGTVENFVACQEQGLTTHLGDLAQKHNHVRSEGIFKEEQFSYDAQRNSYTCPTGQQMKPRRLHPQKRTWEYHLPKGVCAQCALRSQCTRSKSGRTLRRHEHQDLLDRARSQAESAQGKKDRRRRQHLIERSFAESANEHGFKHSRWRRLWRQQIQDYWIAAIQNIRLLIKHRRDGNSLAMAVRLQGPVELHRLLLAWVKLALAY